MGLENGIDHSAINSAQQVSSRLETGERAGNQIL
jgi:hypothetical protein